MIFFLPCELCQQPKWLPHCGAWSYSIFLNLPPRQLVSAVPEARVADILWYPGNGSTGVLHHNHAKYINPLLPLPFPTSSPTEKKRAGGNGGTRGGERSYRKCVTWRSKRLLSFCKSYSVLFFFWGLFLLSNIIFIPEVFIFIITTISFLKKTIWLSLGEGRGNGLEGQPGYLHHSLIPFTGGSLHTDCSPACISFRWNTWLRSLIYTVAKELWEAYQE